MFYYSVLSNMTATCRRW